MKKKILKTLIMGLMCVGLISVGSKNQVEAETIVTEIEVDGNFEWVGAFNDGMALVYVDDKYGYIDKNGKQVIKCQYGYAGDFCDGLARVEGVDGKWGYIDKSGKQVIKCQYDYARDFSEGLAVVYAAGRYGYIDKSGRQIIKCQYNDAWPFSEGLAAVYIDGKWGYIDKSGKQIIKCQYDEAVVFSDGLAWVEADGQILCIDKSGNQIIKSQYNDAWAFSEGLAKVEVDEKWGYIDKSGKQIIKCQYDWASDFSEGLAWVEVNGKRGYIDKSGKQVIKCQYDNAWTFSEGVALVKVGGKYGYINKSGKQVIKCQYGRAQTFNEGLALVRANNKEVLLKVESSGTKTSEELTSKDVTVKLSKTSYSYDGKQKKPSVKIYNSKGKVLNAKYYSVKYLNNVKVGKATATITFKGKYSGTIKKTFTIKPAKTTITGTSRKSDSVTLTWKKQKKEASGYQIQYATDRKFTKNAKTVVSKGTKKSSKKISGLSKKTTYYFRIRTYKTVNGKKYYSGWSKIETVKTK